MAPLGVAGVKIVGDFDNYTRGLPSEMAVLYLMDPRTGRPIAFIDATAITDMRTGAMTALGAKHLARRDADIVVEASRLTEPTPLLKTAWIARSACVIPYGTMSAVELSLTDIMDKVVIDDWGQCKGGILGSLRAHVETGRLSERNLHGELGEIAAGKKAGRERDDETILFLAPRTQHDRHRPRPRDARQGQGLRDRATAALRVIALSAGSATAPAAAPAARRGVLR